MLSRYIRFLERHELQRALQQSGSGQSPTVKSVHAVLRRAVQLHRGGSLDLLALAWIDDELTLHAW